MWAWRAVYKGVDFWASGTVQIHWTQLCNKGCTVLGLAHRKYWLVAGHCNPHSNFTLVNMEKQNTCHVWQRTGRSNFHILMQIIRFELSTNTAHHKFWLVAGCYTPCACHVLQRTEKFNFHILMLVIRFEPSTDITARAISYQQLPNAVCFSFQP